MMKPLSLMRLALALLALAVLPARAAVLYVEVDSSTFGTGALYFDFADGDGAVNNTATISSFDPGTGSLGASVTDPDPTSAISGTLPGTVTMSDDDPSSFIVTLIQDMAFGDGFSFSLNVTENQDTLGGALPDYFALTVFIDATDEYITLLQVDLYETGYEVSLEDPLLTWEDRTPTPTPTPGSFWLALMGGALLLASRGMARQRAWC